MFLKEGEELKIDLIPDPAQLNEMSDHGALIDEDIKDARLVMRPLMYNVSSETEKGNALFEVTFHSGKEYRFTYASLCFEFKTPEDIYVRKIAPMHKKQYGKMLKLHKLGFGVKLIDVGINLEGETAQQEVLFSTVMGSGAGTKKIKWTFEAHKDNKEGLKHEILLFMTVPSDIEIMGHLSANATVSDDNSWLRLITNTHEHKIKTPLIFSILSKDDNKDKKTYLDNFIRHSERS